MRFARTVVTALVATSALGVASATPATAVDAPTDLLISEYIEGTGFNKAVEIYNGTGAPVDLSTYTLSVYFNGAATTTTNIALSGTVADGDVHVFGDNDADAGLLALIDQTTTSNLWNGDDAIVLTNDGVVVDSIGQVGFDPGSAWGNTQDHTLRRMSSVCAGDTVVDDLYDTAEWDEYAVNTFDGFGTHTTDCDDDPVELRINEIHYDNDGGDTGEAVEVFGAAGTDLTGYSIVLYNGSPTQLNVYNTVALTGTIPDLDGTGTGVVFEPITGIQNGAPDGLALVAPDDTVVEFLSYEGTFVPVDGPAAGMTSTDIGVIEAGNEPEGLSLQRVDATTWTGPVCESFGALNDPTATTDCDNDPDPGDDPVELSIPAVQGSGFASPYGGQRVTIDGFVVGDFQGGDSFNGFHVQEPVESSDNDASTSDGVFVYSNTPVEIGDFVTVTGTVAEFNGLTEVSAVESVVVSASDLTPPAPTPFSLPADATAREAVEGMLVTLPQDLTISEYFNFDRYNEIVLTTGRQNQPTAVVEPGPDAVALAAEQEKARIMLDDGRSSQNSNPARHPNGEPFTLDNMFRGGDLVTDVTGVMDYSFDVYRIQPTQGATYTAMNDRPDVPDVGGNLTVASFNVLNYFSTLDTNPGSDNGPNICGPSVDQECRGANDENERTRQLDKIVAAMTAIGADVFGIIEVENTAGVEAMSDIVGGLNATFGDGTYAYVDTETIGTDVIKVGFIYNTTTATPIGDYAILDESVDARFDTDKNRPALAQTFRSVASGGDVTVSVNHLKSKGSACDDVGDPDLGDGAGNCNITRTEAAEALADWMLGDPTGTGAPTLIVGDLNSYDQEDPIDALKAAGYTDLVAEYQGDEAYSYVFDGKVGYLDHALADADLADSVTGAAVWHINADEADLIDYDTSFKQDAQDVIYAPDPYRSSDHDPVIVGLDLCDAEPPVIDLRLSTDELWPPIGILLPVRAYVSATDAIDGDVEVELVSVVSDEPNVTTGPWWKRWLQEDIIVLDDDLFLLRAERDPRGDGRTYTITYSATDSCGNWSLATATVEVPKSRGHKWR